MAEDASTLLTSQAAEISQAIYSLLKKGLLTPSDKSRYRTAHDIAARLHLISTYLSSLPPYWVESDLEQLCGTTLAGVQDVICPTKGSAVSRFPDFGSLFNRPNPPDQKTCLATFFKTQTEKAQRLKEDCDILIGMLTKDENEAEALPESVLQPLEKDNSSGDFHDDVFKALQSISECDPASHETNDTMLAYEQDPGTLRHLARLSLRELGTGQDSTSRNVVILVSAINMALWQEFFLKTQPESFIEKSRQPLSRGGFCSILEKDYTARLFLSFTKDHGLFLLDKTEVLKQMLRPGLGESLKDVFSRYELTPKDKVMLSYAVARSYWQYYDSELMRTKWTSNTIWFMPEIESRGHDDQLPLCAYLSFPFGVPSNTAPDVLYEGMLNHRCPRIFDIGVLLLEIGLAKPFRTGKRRDLIAQANLSHKIATDQLLELEEANWDGFTNNKKHFDQAVRFCLHSENFIPPPKQPKGPRQGGVQPTRPPTDAELKTGILTRRKIFYKNVVRPLAWLAKKGFRAQDGDITYVNKKKTPAPQIAVPGTPDGPDGPEALFHSAIIPQKWLEDLKKISGQVERNRRRHRATTPVRVAILDTGLNRDFPAFKADSRLLKGVVEERDFVEANSETMTDAFGHGTFMVRLLMECAPNVEILVARVAASTSELGSSQENIEKAILWAGQTGKADIISMSFGFPRDHQGICEAIQNVQKERKDGIIFLASTGNSYADDESFPARHPDVISVSATNCHGVFLHSNSTNISNGSAILGTYGDDISDSIRDEFRTIYPNVCQPGSSVATVVMAGISSILLSYLPVLPSLVSLQGKAASTSDQVLQRLRTGKGMEAVLHRLARTDPDHSRCRAVNPMLFWKNRPNDIQRYCSICDALSDIDRRLPI